MDKEAIQRAIETLNAEIQRLTSARDTLHELTGDVGAGAAPAKRPQPPTAYTAYKGKGKPPAPVSQSVRSIAQRKRWAEQKRKQREAAKAAKKGKGNQ